MRHIIFLFMLATAISAQAQNPADEVINHLLRDREVGRYFKGFNKNENYEGALLVSSFEQNNFFMPAACRARLEKMFEELRGLHPQAYKFVEHTAGDDAPRNLISIDNGPYKSVSDSPDDNSIMICFHSTGDSLRRYANLFTWNEKADSIRGTIYRIYGLDPSKKTEHSLRILGKDIDFRTINLNDYGRNIMIQSDGDRRWIEFGGPKAKKELLPELGDTTAIANSTDFIREFTRLHTLFIGVIGKEAPAFQNTILTRMDNLVCHHGNKFQMKSECNLCIQMLQSMKKEVRDFGQEKTVKGYIDIIISRLKKWKRSVPA